MSNEFEIVKSTRIAHINLFLNELEYRTSHMHGEFEVIYVITNPLKVRYPETEFILQEGEGCIVNPNQVHQLEKTGKASTFICLQFSPLLFESTFTVLKDMRFKSGSVFNKEMRDTLLSLSLKWQNPDDSMNLEIHSLLFHLVYTMVGNIEYHMMNKKEKQEEEDNIARIARLLRFIDQNYTHKIRLSDFAESENLSLSYVSHYAKRMLSEPFQDYVNFLRFSYAKKLLTSSTASLTETAYLSGFSNLNYMNLTFMKHAGMTAKEYRNSMDSKPSEDMKRHISAHSSEKYHSRRRSIEILESLMH